MDYSEIGHKHRLWFGAQNNCFGDESFENSKKLAAAVGVPYLRSGYWVDHEYTPEQITLLERLATAEGPSLIRLLRGPYGKTLLKVWEIQRAKSVV